MPNVQDIMHIMEDLAPPYLAESWDHAGLQTGCKDWPVQTIWVALDPLPEVVTAACNLNVDLLITHHPLIFQPLTSLDFNSPIGSILHQSAVNRLSIYSSHTNLDKAAGGLNDMLLERIGLEPMNVLLSESPDSGFCKLVLYVPAEYEERMLDVLFQTPAGAMGEYSCCTFRNAGKGSFLPGSHSKPFIGQIGVISHVDEVRIETIIKKKDIPLIYSQIRDHHPYQTPAIDIYPLLLSDNRQGLGRVGKLKESVTLLQFAQSVKEKLGLPLIKISGKPDMMVHQAAICSGSGSSLLKNFFASTADVYISGDLRYHDARSTESTGKALLDIGHFSSERFMIDEISNYLRQKILDKSWEIQIEACPLENDPFIMI